MKRIILMAALLLFISVGTVFGFNTGDLFTGEAKSDRSSKVWQARIKITAYDQSNGDFSGELSWPALKSVHKIVGRVDGRIVTFKETEAIQKGSAHLNCEYALIISDKGLMEGRWIEPQFDRGSIMLR